MIHSLILPVIYAFFSSLPYALLFNIHGVNTLVAALAVGVLLVSSTVRLMTAIQHNRRTRKT